ncbi:hypothetical protein KO494_13450 [Lacinutrix sp. C3R15]|uniref:hypothetical protein n=1 Tax=Flavobacteriaceae TaxID=49546 RepID=UPI001C093598|nr:MULTISPECIES: hypothetical protein [Flavobacteriaceae]MBU2940548.1 hypothetical protein [Lacinutrix sp. C3R15]MDO6623868.1 hypothetical protein [Oceanihabitans sp. 1_MG-2023]
MKLCKQFNSSILLLTILTIFMVSCNIDDFEPMDNEQEQEQTFALDDLQGDWIRVGGNNPVNNGLKVNVQNDLGILTDAQQSGFVEGDIKWKNIVGLGNGAYTHDELGSDYNYYSATIQYGVDDTLRVDVNHSGLGNIQKWVREANFTPQSVFLQELEGSWIRVGGNNPVNNDVVVEVLNTNGTITDAALSGFSNGDIKWKDIYAIDANSFIYEELGSDYNYYTAEMEIGVADTLRISVNHNGTGNIQKWVRQ